MTLAPYVRILGVGPGRSRSLTQPEAFEALSIILRGDAAPEATGALLMLMRMKGETAAELAGFVQAARAHVDWSATGDTAPGTPALDWPSYAAGRTRGLPWFLLSARIVAAAGYPVLLHGWNSHQAHHADVRAGLARLDIPRANDLPSARAALAAHNIAYLPLEALSPRLYALLTLRNALGLRSCINTVLRLLNPGAAPASVQGVFHPPYLEIQADACALLGQPALSVIKGGGGEFERHPGKAVTAFGLRDGERWSATFQAADHAPQRLAEVSSTPDHLRQLWEGSWDDPFARAIVLGTAAMALDTLGAVNPETLAHDVWQRRHDAQAA